MTSQPPAVTVKKIVVADEEVVLTALWKVDGTVVTKKVRGLGNTRTRVNKKIPFFTSPTLVLLFRDSYFV